MKLFHRPFSGDIDKYKMDILAQQSTTDNLHVIDLPYRLSSWALANPDNIRLWFDEPRALNGENYIGIIAQTTLSSIRE
jgi:hypothetical protein